MAYFPLFIDLDKKTCVVVGGGNTALRKIERLVDFGCEIKVVSSHFDPKLEVLSHDYKLELIHDSYDGKYLAGAYMVIAATDDPDINEEIYDDAISIGALVNVVDCPDRCSFYFPAIVKRDDLVVGISSSGSYPALTKSVRKKTDELLPPYYGHMVELLKNARVRVMDEIKSPVLRKKILEILLLEFDNVGSKEDVDKIGRVFDEVVCGVISKFKMLEVEDEANS